MHLFLSLLLSSSLFFLISITTSQYNLGVEAEMNYTSGTGRTVSTWTVTPPYTNNVVYMACQEGIINFHHAGDTIGYELEGVDPKTQRSRWRLDWNPHTDDNGNHYYIAVPVSGAGLLIQSSTLNNNWRTSFIDLHTGRNTSVPVNTAHPNYRLYTDDDGDATTAYDNYFGLIAASTDAGILVINLALGRTLMYAPHDAFTNKCRLTFTYAASLVALCQKYGGSQMYDHYVVSFNPNTGATSFAANLTRSTASFSYNKQYVSMQNTDTAIVMNLFTGEIHAGPGTGSHSVGKVFVTEPSYDNNYTMLLVSTVSMSGYSNGIINTYNLNGGFWGNSSTTVSPCLTHSALADNNLLVVSCADSGNYFQSPYVASYNVTTLYQQWRSSEIISASTSGVTWVIGGLYVPEIGAMMVEMSYGGQYFMDAATGDVISSSSRPSRSSSSGESSISRSYPRPVNLPSRGCIMTVSSDSVICVAYLKPWGLTSAGGSKIDLLHANSLSYDSDITQAVFTIDDEHLYGYNLLTQIGDKFPQLDTIFNETKLSTTGFSNNDEPLTFGVTASGPGNVLSVATVTAGGLDFYYSPPNKISYTFSMCGSTYSPPITVTSDDQESIYVAGQIGCIYVVSKTSSAPQKVLTLQTGTVKELFSAPRGVGPLIYSNPNSTELVAIDRSNGTVFWRKETVSPLSEGCKPVFINSTDAAGSSSNKNLVACLCEGSKLGCYDAQTGRLSFQYGKESGANVKALLPGYQQGTVIAVTSESIKVLRVTSSSSASPVIYDKDLNLEVGLSFLPVVSADGILVLASQTWNNHNRWHVFNLTHTNSSLNMVGYWERETYSSNFAQKTARVAFSKSSSMIALYDGNFIDILSGADGSGVLSTATYSSPSFMMFRENALVTAADWVNAGLAVYSLEFVPTP